MKRKFLAIAFSLLCMAGSFATVAGAATTEMDFENVTALTDIKGSDKFFTNSSNVIAETAVIETETTGTYTNKYLSVKYKAGNNVFVSQPILDNDVTVVSARLKFYSGSQSGLIIRTGSNQYLAVNNGGGANLRLMNNASYVLTGYEGKWVDVRYVITKKSDASADITGYMMLTGQPDTMITCSLNNFAINSGTHLRFSADGGEKGSIDNLVVKSYSAEEATVLVKEDFRQFGADVQSTKDAAFSSNSLMQTNVANSVKIVSDGNNKYMAITDSTAILHNFKVPAKKKSVLSFDVKMSAVGANAKVFLRPTTSGEYRLVSFESNSQAYVMGYQINGLAQKLTSEFVHFDFVIDTDGTQTTVNGYMNGQWISKKSWTSLVFGDLRAQTVAGTEIYLDNIVVSTPGIAVMKAELAGVSTNEATVALSSNNIIDPATIAVKVDGAVYDVTKELTDNGKAYTLTLKNLGSNKNYNVTVSASDYFGQAMEEETVSVATEAIATEVTVLETASIMNDIDDKATAVVIALTPNDYSVNGIKWKLSDKKSFNTSFGTEISGEATITTALYIEDLYIENFNNDMVSVQAISGDVSDSVATFAE